jgi:hypothetical protein
MGFEPVATAAAAAARLHRRQGNHGAANFSFHSVNGAAVHTWQLHDGTAERTDGRAIYARCSCDALAYPQP